MITSNLYSMSVKDLFTRLSVLLVMCAFAVSAKATATITPIPGEDKAFMITMTEPDDLPGPESASTFYEMDGTIITVGEVKKLVITTNFANANQNLNEAEFRKLKEKYTSLSYLDLENSAVDNAAFGGNDKYLNAMSQLRTLVFPKANGLVIPDKAFQNNTYLTTVIFPDNVGTYQIMEDAFQNSKVVTVSLGKGYSIPDLRLNGTQWKSGTGSGTRIFEHCTELKNVVLDNSITDLGEEAFSATYKLEYLILPEELRHIGYLCFKECGIRTITIPDHVTLSSDDQIFQGCINLRNIFVNVDNIKAGKQALMEMAQTMNFNWAGHDQTCSTDDYSPASMWNGSNYDDSPFKGKYYTIPVLHYPGTNTAINNYRTPFYMHYSGQHDLTDTTWPNAFDMSNKENGSAYEHQDYYGGTYPSFYSSGGESSEFAGWKQFLIGNNIFKEQKVFYDERIKESRWYSICLPINMTEAQFMNAYGVGAALHEFTGAEYNEKTKTIVLKFDTPAKVEGGYLLKKGVPYMIHPAKIKFTKRKEIIYSDLNGSIEFQKETVDGQEDYVTTDVIATFDVESDLFINWNDVLTGGDPFDNRVETILSNTTASLAQNAQLREFRKEDFPSFNFTFKGSYLGAPVWGPVTKYIGESPNLPLGAYYLGFDPKTMTQPKFFKAKGTAKWSPYCALVVAEEVTGGSDSGAKDFNVLDVDFNKADVVVTKIGKPTIQIPVVNKSSKIYNLNGQVVRENSKDTNGLKGIYVVGGKKVVFN